MWLYAWSFSKNWVVFSERTQLNKFQKIDNNVQMNNTDSKKESKVQHLDRVSVFIEVVRREGFSPAARYLGMTGSAVSKQVQSLERQLGIQLLTRTTRKVTLTEAGQLYFERARQALDDLSDVEAELQDRQHQPTGTLKINAPMAFGTQFLVGPLAQFAVRYPQLILDVDFDDRQVDMVAEGYDLSVRIGALRDSTLKARCLASCPIWLCASPELIERLGCPEQPDDLKGVPGIGYSQVMAQTEWRYQCKGASGSLVFPVAFRANSAAMMREVCLAGLGIALLPIFAVQDDVNQGRLLRLFPDYTTIPERHIYAVYPPGRYLSNKVRLLIDWLVETCAELPFSPESEN
jgi:DNA-binding transcriptional LysR family regulator